eukprot:98291_1
MSFRLTGELICRAGARLNPLQDRELDLRGYKIPMIENLGVAQDQFDAINFSDNEIRSLGNFPRSRRLSMILLNNNHVAKVDAKIAEQLPNLSCLILTNNRIVTLSDIDNLKGCKKLTMLSLLHNPVVRRQHYRLYVIHTLPSLTTLDYQKVKLDERKQAERLFRSKAGAAMQADMANEKSSNDKVLTFTPGGEGEWPAPGLTQQQKASLLAMIEKATSADEVDRLAKILETGEFPEEGLDGEEKKVEVKKDDGKAAVKEMKMENRPSAASEMPADVSAVSTPPSYAEKSDNVDMEVTDDNKNDEVPKSKSSTPTTTPTKAESKRKGKGKTPTRSPVKAGRGGKKEGNKEVAAVPKTPPTLAIDSDNKEVQAMDTEGPETSKPVLSENEIKAMTVAILKKTLKDRNEPTTGLKKELKERLLVSCGHAT